MSRCHVVIMSFLTNDATGCLQGKGFAESSQVDAAGNSTAFIEFMLRCLLDAMNQIEAEPEEVPNKVADKVANKSAQKVLMLLMKMAI